jgi:phage repressor protein C with HTH and peptisase S24 domain
MSDADDDLGSDVVVRAPNPEQVMRQARLREAVKSAGGNRSVALRAGVPLATLNNHLAGRDMKASTLVALARAANVSIEWLATGDGPRALVTVPKSGQDTPAAAPRRTPGTVQIARYDARAAAGQGDGLSPGTIIETISFSETWVRTVLRRNPAHLALIECRGDSMEPTLRDGDVLMVDTSVMEVRSSRIYVLEVEGNLLVKRIQRMLDGRLRIASDNPRYEAELLTPSDRDPLRIVGEVVWQSGLARS